MSSITSAVPKLTTISIEPAAIMSLRNSRSVVGCWRMVWVSFPLPIPAVRAEVTEVEEAMAFDEMVPSGTTPGLDAMRVLVRDIRPCGII
jgi:hypothetical protein